MVSSLVKKFVRDLSPRSLQSRSDLHLARKFWHMGTGLTGLSVYYLSGWGDNDVGLGLVVFACLAFIGEVIRLNSKSINKKVVAVMGRFMRDSEKNSYSGFPFYALGVGLTLIFYSEHIAILSVMFLVFSDPISSFFGILFGRKKLIGNKSVQGTIAGILTCFFLTIGYCLVHFGEVQYLVIYALLAGLIGGFAELCSYKIDDNLTLPVVAGFGLSLLEIPFNVLVNF